MLQLFKSKGTTMSNIGKEFECRMMLTESEYLNIVSYYIKLHPNKQFLKIVNRYYDTDDLYIKNHHMTLRVRTTNNMNGELTLKIKHPNGDDEINNTLSSKDAENLLHDGIFPEGEVKNRLLSLPYSLNSYKQIAVLYNLRLEIPFEDHLLVLDKNNYSDITDYNLEIEAKDSIETAKKRLYEYIAQFNLAKPQQKYVGKSHRAIDAAIKNS